MAGLVIAAVALASRGSVLPRNRLVRIRTRSTLRSDAAWEAAHRATSTLLAFAAAPFVAGAIVVIPLEDDGVAAGVVATVACVVGGGVVLAAGVKAGRAARAASGNP